ncbi:MAG: D-alanyl-D-alanine carboxypeptidase, partial [Planctomycetota bacterium]
MRLAAIVFSCVVLAGCAGAPAPRLDGMLAAHDDHPVEVCALAVDLDTGEVLLSRAAQRLCRPASAMKLLTTSSICRRRLDRSFRTRVVSDGAPGGRVTFVGSGDPFLTTADLRRMAAALVGQGVAEVDPQIRVVDPLRDAPRWGEGWMWDDEPSGFQPLLSGAVVDRGCVTVALRGGSSGLEASLRPVAGALQLDVVGRGGAVRATRGRYRG